jgi:carbonic anhydrase
MVDRHHRRNRTGTRGILWLILETAGYISKEQVATFVKIIGEGARDSQPLNARFVVHQRAGLGSDRGQP